MCRGIAMICNAIGNSIGTGRVLQLQLLPDGDWRLLVVQEQFGVQKDTVFHALSQDIFGGDFHRVLSPTHGVDGNVKLEPIVGVDALRESGPCYAV